MSDKASAQQDLLKELYNYSATIIPGTETLIAELRHNRQSDTDELFNSRQLEFSDSVVSLAFV
jgi:hypothetical protein